MARTREQNEKLIADYIAAYKAANPGEDVRATYLPGGFVSISQGIHRREYRPSKVEKMIETLRARAGR